MDRENSMKRALAMAAVAAVLFALVGSHETEAGPKKRKKITICHVRDGQRMGVVITISRNALDAHCGHGDSQNFLSKKGTRTCVPFGPCKRPIPKPK